MRNPNGFTLTEVALSTVILTILMLAFASLLKYSTVATTKILSTGESQESARIGLNKIEEALSHANEITLSSGTLIEFIDDIDQNPSYNPNACGVSLNPANNACGSPGANAVQNYLNPDRANTITLWPAGACNSTCTNAPCYSPGGQWMGAGDNLQNDDEDGDCNIDVLKRIYWANGSVYLDTCIDCSASNPAWGTQVQLLIPHVSSFTFTYFGSLAMPPGNGTAPGAGGTLITLDQNNDGILEESEIECQPAAFNCTQCTCPATGVLTNRTLRKYIAYIDIHLEVSNSNGATVYTVDTDVYPPLLPLKSVAT